MKPLPEIVARSAAQIKAKTLCHRQPDGWHLWVADNGAWTDKGLCTHDHSDYDQWPDCMNVRPLR